MSPRLAFLTFVVLAAIAAGIAPGCLRRKFDLCLEDPPHPDCPRDAGADGGTAAGDASAPDAPSADATADDAPR
jgi:hypothetical protein